MPRPPNVFLVLADDLGPGDLGCYGQQLIQTPNLDGLASRGTRFTSAYAGSPVCAPSRCTLLTGLHSGHSAVRDNREITPEGQLPLPQGTVTLGRVLKDAGYATAAVGKWGLGPPGSTGEPFAHGFDVFFGYNCQRHAHNHYPRWVYDGREKFMLGGNPDPPGRGDRAGAVYAPDLMRDRAAEFIRANRDRPFFLYFATTIPHLALQVPADSLEEYAGRIDDAPYDGSKGYLAHPSPRAAYAAMVTRMDRDIGVLLSLIRELGLERDTLVVFASDNGPTFDIGGADTPFFDSAQGRRGFKGQLYEGGIRVPLIVSLPGIVREGAECAVPVALWDLFPTVAEFAGARVPAGLDGVGLRGLLTGGPAPQRESLYWEFPAGAGAQAVRIGSWKGVRRGLKKNPGTPFELYDLASDPREEHDVAPQNPEVVARMLEIAAERTHSPIPEWNY